MITPSFGLTATERVLPKLALDFTTASLDPRVTFTRAGNTATRINSSGLIEVVNADLPRFDYDPITLACRGLLVEELRANLAVYSEEFIIGSGWGFTNANRVVAAVSAPNGAASVIKLEETAVSGIHAAGTTIGTVAVGDVYTASIFAQAAERTLVWITSQAEPFRYFNLANGTASSPANSTITNLGGGWYRCTTTFTKTNTNGTFNFGTATSTSTPVHLGVAGSGVYFWGAQIEAGAFATSYIPTTTTALTRNADVATMTGTNFSDWYNATEGAIQAEFSFVGYSTANRDRIVSISNSTGTSEIVILQQTTNGYGRFEVVNSGSNQALLDCINTTMVAGTTYKICGAYKANSFVASGSLGSQATDSSGTVPTVDRMCIGGFVDGTATLVFSGHMRKINYWPQRITNNETRAFAK
jgi:hypothetical protein